MSVPVFVGPGARLRSLLTLHDLEPAGNGVVGLCPKGKPVKASFRLTSLEALFEQGYDTPAHAVAYAIVRDGEPLPRQPRINKGALDSIRSAGYDVLCFTVWLDLDLKHLLPDAWARKKAAEPEADKLRWTDLQDSDAGSAWTRIEDARIHLAQKGLEWVGCYTTSGGFRFVHALAQPVPAGEPYEGLLRRIHATYRVAGLPIDEACKDWTRVYKCPRVTAQIEIKDEEGNVVRTEPGERSWEQEWFTYALDQEALDSGEGFLIPEAADLTAPSLAPVVSLVHTERERPTPEAARALVEVLTEKDGKTNWRPTEAAKKAKKELADAAVYGWIFDRLPLALPGKRHDMLTRAVGEVLGYLHGFPWASPEFVYGLLHDPVAGLGEDEDWLGKLWEMTCTFWDRETQRKAQQQAKAEQEAEQHQEQTRTQAQILLAGMRTWCQDLARMTDEEALAWIQQQRMGVLMDARRDLYHILLGHGYYDDKPCGTNALPKLIEQRRMDWLVPTTAPRDNGRGEITISQIHPLQIIQRSARVFSDREIRLDQRGSYLTRDLEGRDVFVEVPFYLRDDIQAEFDPMIFESWMAAAGWDQDEAERRLRATASLLLFRYGPTAAVLHWGTAAAGKSLMALSLAECLSTRTLADGDSLVDNFNDTLRRSPIIHVEEAANKGSKGIDASGALRRIITAPSLMIEQKGRDKTQMQGVHRVLFTANSRDIVYSMIGTRARTAADWKAVGERIAEFRVDEEATRWFEKNNRGWAETRRWIGKGDRVGAYAKFWFWVMENLIEWDDGRPVMQGKRLLFEGNAAGHLIQHMEANAGAVPEVATAINRLLALQGPKPKAILEEGRVYLTTSAVVEEVRAGGARLRDDEIRTALESICIPLAEERPYVRGVRARWKAVDAKRLLSLIEEHTVPNKILEAFRE